MSSIVSKLSGGIEPTTRAFLEHVNAQKGPKIYEIPVEQGRAAFTKMQNSVCVKKLPVETEDYKIPSEHGEVSFRILRPKGTKGPLPVIVYTHGAGWVFGDLEVYDRLIRDITDGAEAALVFVNFSRSPEAKFPVAIEQVYAVLKHVAQNGKLLNLDTSHIAVAGDSVGGNMTTVLAMMAKERGGPHIGLQLLFYPVTDASFDTASYREYACDHFLTLDAMKWFWDQYIPDDESRQNPWASPLQATVEQLKGLPSAVIINGEFDVLRDEGEAYAHKLIEAGVTVKAVRFHGTIHDFVMLNSLAETPAARSAISFACEQLRTFFASK